ncbi:hypothetical protein TRAPUB_6016 [Trametes pubescens]|uniref:Uncharacterized protein n=1 Tax=Trametes pubescens TaxID=154538 RepID=A0A1M2V723_TRAPU|nr:hypothetical protein TRAPUB_6016 [Trametes pubescens]
MPSSPGDDRWAATAMCHLTVPPPTAPTHAPDMPPRTSNAPLAQEYTRDIVGVHPLGPLTPLSATSGTTSAPATDAYLVPRVAPELPALDALGPSVPAHTYIHAGALRELSPELWSYADFVRESAWKWVGESPVNEEYYAEVDRRKDLDGQTLRTATVDTAGEDARGDGRTVVAVISGAV